MSGKRTAVMLPDVKDTTDHKAWAKGVSTSTRALMAGGLAATGFFALGFGAWAALAPLEGAAQAPGFISAAGQNQRVQHLEGGIVQTIYAHEGEKVKAGDVLFKLDGTAAEAQRNQLEKQVVALAARAVRLVAERDDFATLTFPAELIAEAKDGDVEELLVEQEKEFTVRLERHRQEGVILRQRVNALNEQITGLGAQQTAVERQLAVVEEETTRKKLLLDKA